MIFCTAVGWFPGSAVPIVSEGFHCMVIACENTGMVHIERKRITNANTSRKRLTGMGVIGFIGFGQ